jgi:hypothetical protein
VVIGGGVVVVGGVVGVVPVPPDVGVVVLTVALPEVADTAPVGVDVLVVALPPVVGPVVVLVPVEAPLGTELPAAPATAAVSVLVVPVDVVCCAGVIGSSPSFLQEKDSIKQKSPKTAVIFLIL